MLTLGRHRISPPIVLAPMAGVTTPAFRRLCRRFGAPLTISEMVSARGLLEGGASSWELVSFDPGESPRSVQISGADPAVIGEAVHRLVDRGVEHVDLNVGCPAPKVTRNGGGAALPARPALFGAVVAAAVRAAEPSGVPVTVKMRAGLDHDRLTFRDAGRIAADAGVAAVALHARTVEQRYAGPARPAWIAELAATLDPLPVLGNGDIWSADDALALMRGTGCAGVVIGRGCLGRPWLFADLRARLAGGQAPPAPAAGAVADLMLEHATALVSTMGERRGVADFRKHVAWYLHGYPVDPDLIHRLRRASSIDELRVGLAGLDPDAAVDPALTGAPRGTTAGPGPVALPDRWLERAGDLTPPGSGADLAVSGG